MKQSLTGQLPCLLQPPRARCARHLFQSTILPLPFLLLSLLLLPLPLSVSPPLPLRVQPPNRPSARQSSQPSSHLSDQPSYPPSSHLLAPQSALSPRPYWRLAHQNLLSTLTALFALSLVTPSPLSALSRCPAKNPHHPSPLTLLSELSLSPESLRHP